MKKRVTVCAAGRYVLPTFAAVAFVCLGLRAEGMVSISDFVPYMRAGRIAVRVQVTNALDRTVAARLTANIGGLIECATNITVAAGRVKLAILLFGDVPDRFPLTKFGWKVCVESSGGSDAKSGTADVDGAIRHLAATLIGRQERQPNARYCDYFFADVYAARALMGLGDAWTNAAWSASGRRWVEEGLVARQHEDGGYPMGYGEEAGVHWVADNGTAALGVVDAAARYGDVRERYLASVKRYYGFRDSFYQSAERVVALEGRFGKDPHFICEGLYGIGVNDGDYVDRLKEKARATAMHQKLKAKPKGQPLVRTERGLPWVNGISLLSLPAYWRMTGDTNVLAVALRDLDRYLDGAKTLNYFGAETIYQCVRNLPPSPSVEKARKLLEDGFLKRLSDNWGEDKQPKDKGGRRTLDALTAVYALHDSGGARQDLRSYVAYMAWYVASREYRRSVFNAERLFAKSYFGEMSGKRYEAMSLAWLAELMRPGCTLPLPECAARRDVR